MEAPSVIYNLSASPVPKAGVVLFDVHIDTTVRPRVSLVIQSTYGGTTCAFEEVFVHEADVHTVKRGVARCWGLCTGCGAEHS